MFFFLCCECRPGCTWIRVAVEDGAGEPCILRFVRDLFC